MVDVVDIINSVADNKPVDTVQLFDQAMKERIAPVIQQKKLDMAASFFAGRNIYEEEPEDEALETDPVDTDNEEEESDETTS